MLLAKRTSTVRFKFDESSKNRWLIYHNGEISGMAFAVSVKDSCYNMNGRVVHSDQIEGWVDDSEMQLCDQFWAAALNCGMQLPHCYKLSNLRDTVESFYQVEAPDEF